MGCQHFGISYGVKCITYCSSCGKSVREIDMEIKLAKSEQQVKLLTEVINIMDKIKINSIAIYGTDSYHTIEILEKENEELYERMEKLRKETAK